MPATSIASVVATNSGEIYQTALTSDKHVIVADEPADQGGSNEGPSPVDLLCMSLASCKAITLRMYAKRKDWNTGTITVKVDLLKSDPAQSTNNTFSCELAFTGQLTDEQKQRLHEISKACPIQKLLTQSAEVVSVLL